MKFKGPLADSYPAAVALVVCALVPFLMLAAAVLPLMPVISKEVGLSRHALEMTYGMADAAYAFGTVMAVQLAVHLPGRRAEPKWSPGSALRSRPAAARLPYASWCWGARGSSGRIWPPGRRASPPGKARRSCAPSESGPRRHASHRCWAGEAAGGGVCLRGPGLGQAQLHQRPRAHDAAGAVAGDQPERLSGNRQPASRAVDVRAGARRWPRARLLDASQAVIVICHRIPFHQPASRPRCPSCCAISASQVRRFAS